jgi:hypothetical protein
MIRARIGRWMVAALTAACVCPGPAAAQDAAADEAVYRKRFEAYRVAGGNGLERYDPVEQVPGAAAS